jgi:hypothetical protein
MSYENERNAFNRTAKRVMKQAQMQGKHMTFREAQEKTRGHIQKSNSKK